MSKTWQLQLCAGATVLVFVGANFGLPVSDPATRQEASAPPTFYRDVLPILQHHCQSCHRSGSIAPMAFESYEQTRPFAAAIRRAVTEKSMPPWFADPAVGRFANDPALSSAEIATLASWSEAKAPAGDKRDAPPPLLWSESWSIPKPDLVLS